ncbi:MAG: FISUMP domain-containing protein, partial [Bacteroidales bacterium]|nr:FISUMP domain-containing protein [Bacteroidales bacterium]
MKRTVTFLMLLLMAGAAMAQGEFVCGDTVRDGNGNAYATVQIAALCWTKSNMRAVSYADGSPIANAMIYNSNLHPDTTANLANFGRLYTWWSAVNLPEGSDAAPAKDATGFVRGVCPAGWRIPTVADIQKLRTYADEDLHSTDFWVMPNSNTNSTGFSEVPGGMFSAERNRFEGLLSNSYMWTDSSSRREWVVACNSRYFCDKASEENVKKGDGLSVRCVFTMEICPLVTTIAADECDMKYTTAVLKGSATDLEGTLQEYGIVWGLTKNALTNTQLATSITNGNFEATLTGLPACGDTVYYSAFVKQSSCSETVYGDTLMFVVCGHGQDAKPCLLAPTVIDHENNVYNTVQIGNQCWMRENLRTTTSPSTGNRLITDNSTDRTFTGKQARWYGNDSAQYAPQNYGLLYNWNAAVDTFNSTYGEFSVNDNADNAVSVTFNSNRRGICPEGWHLPSDAEWDTLKKYVSSQSQYICGSKNSYIARSLAFTSGWSSSDSSCAVGNVLNTNNNTGFSAVPAGNNVGAQFNHRTYTATFWSSTQAEKRNATNQYMLFNSAEVNEHNNLKSYGFSVRCIKDACEDNAVNATLPTVTTSPVSCYNGNGATGGNVTDDGGAEITARGVCWSTNHNPTIADNHTSDSVGIGTFNSVITNLTPNIVYYVRAYATNVKGTAYGNEETYTRIVDGTPCPCATKVYDHQGNDYNTVWIGCQCWTKENMRATTSPNGYLQNGGNNTSHYKAYYYDNTSVIPLKDRGLLYNWAAAIDSTTTNGIVDGFTKRRGICPEGWHVPALDEYATLRAYVASQSNYFCGDTNRNIAKALASTEYWNTSGVECAVGNNAADNNATGFSAIPAGSVSGFSTVYYNEGEYAALWTSTSTSDTTAYIRRLHNHWSYFTYTDGDRKSFGRSVRCIKDTCGNTLPTSDNCPTVTTTAATNVSSDSAKINGVVTNVSGTVENYGFVWGTSKNTITTTVNGTSVTAMTADGDFSSIIKGLTPCDTIWYAAFTKTSDCDDYVYGDTMWFKVPAPDITTCGKVKDHQNNEYSTVKIGTQCWMAENMRCTTSPKGIMQKGTTQAVFTTPYYFETLSTTIPSTVGGHFYNWQAAMDTSFTAEENISFTNRRGICPVGWHIPSEDDWNTLINYVSSQSDCYACGGNANHIAKSLASKEHWKNNNKECNVGNKASSTNNATGFNVIPTGTIAQAQGMMISEGTNAFFWSSTSVSATTVVTTVMAHNSKIMDRGTATKVAAQSVRCVKDEESTTTCPTVTTGVASTTADDVTKANLSGTVANITGTVEANGFAYGDSKSALTSTKANEGSSDESLEATITGLTPCDTIWYAAFAKTSDCDETVYGDTLFFVAKPAPQDCGTVTDVDGNKYETVKLGNQCWMKENLRTTKYADSTAITAGGSSVSNTVPYYYNTAFSNIDSVQRGYLYNWAAATRSASTRSNNPSNAQGICPTGWHLPSKAEWDTLTNYVSSIPEYLCDGTNASIAKALASKTGWSPSTITCAVGNDTTANNKTGFSAVPVGRCLGSTFIEVGYEANFWSSTLHENNFAFSRYLQYNNAKVLGGTDGRNYGLSVRCLKDADTTATDNCPVITKSSCSIGVKDSVALTGIANNIIGDVTDYGFVYGYSRDAINRVVNSTHPKVIIRQYTDMSIFTYKKLDSVPQCDSVYFVAFLKTDGCSETVYSDTVSFIIKPYPQSCGDVTDVDDNYYHTVQLGSQCWMIENLRTKHFKDGTAIAQGADTSFTIPYYYQPAPAEVTDYNFDYYGLYYNFASVESPKGICPEGWHVPTRSEWDTLSNYVGSQCAYVCGNNDNNFAKALSSHFGWKDSDAECAVGNNQSTNNITSFGAIPMGRYNADAAKFDGVGEYSYFWTSTGYGTNTHYELTNAWTTRYNRPYGLASQYTKTYGFPIRCLRDEATTPTVVIDSLSCPEAKTVTDHEGNVYATVKIGNQCWTRENLRTTTSPSTKTNLIPADGVDYTFTGKQARWYGNDSSQYAPLKYGLLYNWNAAVDTFNTTLGELNVSNNYDYAVSVTFNSHRRGICPEGWHVPSDAEWNTMEQTVSGSDWQDIYANTNGWRGSHAGKLASGDKWNYSLIANAPGDTSYSDRNKSGFSAFPVGKCYGSWFGEAGVNAYFWSSTQISGSNGDAWSRQIGYYDVTVYRTNYFKSNGFSVRCVKDENGSSTDNCPEIIQALYDRIEVDSVTLTGIANNIIGDVTDYGFVYGYSRDAINRIVNSTHPRVTISHYSEVSIFDYDKLDSVPQCGSVYFVAFLKTDGCSETVYSDTVSFIIKPYTQNCGTVTDVDGNTYETVQLGSQCWMKSNLRTKHYADSTEITAGGDNVSATEAYYYDNTSSNIALKQRGYFYNWAAATRNTSSNTIPSGVQGICPDGWHLPSHAEWDALMNYVRSNSCYICGGNSENIAKALASTTGWENYNGTCRVGNDQTLNNATEFSSVPAGNYYGTFQGLLEGTQANFWSSREDENDPNRAWCVLLRTYDKNLNSSNNSKKYGYSVRCLKDADADTLCAPEGDAKPCPGTPTVTDHENNVYNTVQIGDQCWMKENMRCTTSPSGKTAFQAASGSSSYVSPQYYDSESSIPLNDRGLLYNWAAAMDTVFTSENEMNVSFINRRGICPEGWHVPTDYEWNVFENYVNSQVCYQCDDEIDFIAKALSSTKYWKEDDYMSCIVGNDLTKNNATGFSAVPAGMCRFPNYYLDSMQVSFWTSTSASEYGAYFCNIMSHERVVTREAGNDKNTGYSVRCIKNGLEGNPCPGAPTVIDADSNVYNTVRIGNQCWMKENLRTTKYADGSTITAGGNNESSTERYYYDYTTSGIDSVQRGYLYNWAAVMNGAESSNAAPSGVQGICPTGWHVPSYAEWMVLLPYLNSQNQYLCESVNELLAKSLASSTGWNSSNNQCAVGNNQSTNNLTGFSAVPAGYYDGSTLLGAGECAEFWSSTQVDNDLARYLNLYYDHAAVNRGQCNKNYANSVRCVKDVSTIPTVSTAAVSNITDTSATCGGNVTSDGGDNVIARGVCWSTSSNPTVNDSHTTDSSGMGSFTSNITGLTASTTYYVRAYATNSEGTAYGNEVTFVTSGAYDAQPCPGVPTVTDYDGNVYNTVQIGNKCWMKENLRTKHYADGTEIPAGGSSTSDAQPYYYDYVAAPSVALPLELRGYLYNWSAAMNGASSSNTIPSNVQGVCPSGWHLPSELEWIELTNYVSSQSKFRCNVNDKYDNAKALASEIGWAMLSNITGYCVPGNDPSTNNATGFSAIPIAFCNGNIYINEWTMASFWSSTFDGNNVRVLRINKNSQYVNYVGSDFQARQYGLSVRCVKDTGNTSLGAQPCPGTHTVTDLDNNVYNTVQIGNQCWMKENMRSTKYSDGTDIPAGGN